MDTESIKSINDLKRNVLEEFIKSLPNEDKINLKKFVQEHPQTNAAGVFATVRAYVFNTYFRKTPIKEKKSANFADTLDSLLELTEDEEKEK